jgi:protein-L-isoaspartate(D-aspartate) O-methyltransferase
MVNRQTQHMIDDIEREVRYTSKMIGRNKLAGKVMAAMASTPRDQFIPKSQLEYAYSNGPLSIGYGQTISQPYIVALMTDLLELEADHVVLEIGTGSGYQAAILSQLCKQVYTIEYVPELAEFARLRLQKLGYENIETKTGNGYDGWPEHAPFDGIIVTAAATHIPEPLLEQLKPGGRMVIPIGERYFYQELILLEKDADGNIERKDILSVAFVPFQGER